MLMSKSRLEKFLYALYSLDSSDLPTPLSRIEELYKCWVTGEEAPIFKPLSRVEKYLMAILGAYDVDSLPNPLSRVEMLLYKLATGDDSLEDFDTFLSEHEELLAGIIGNGGVGGNIDIEYVLYTLSTEFNTLYNTAEKPVKSAILKGNTLVNILNYNNVSLSPNNTINEDGVITISGNGGWSNAWIRFRYAKPNTQYLMRIHVIENTLVGSNLTVNAGNEGEIFEFKVGSIIEPGQTGIFNFILTSKNDISNAIYGFRGYCSSSLTSGYIRFKVAVIEYQQDMENWDIPYFYGMSSVKLPVLTTTGKNLFDGYLEKGWSSTDGSLIDMDRTRTNLISVEKNETYTVSRNKKTTLKIDEFDENFNFIKTTTYQTLNATLITSAQTKHIRIFIAEPLGEVANHELQLEKRNAATSYEPYKSNILTVNEDVELRGIGEVQDELNLITGELTKRFEEIVFDGSESWTQAGSQSSGFIRLYTSAKIKKAPTAKAISPNFPSYNGSSINYGVNGTENITGISSNNFFNINIRTDRIGVTDLTDKNGNIALLKQWLSNNPITFQYELETESVKTVDISVVDQDGNNTELSTFDDLTHVTLSSEGLIPEAELEVATKNEDAINTMSLRMDDISTTQTTLEETSNIQSENVDATMIAATEIYEELL